MAMSRLQLASLLVLICSLSLALAQSSCKIAVNGYSDNKCTSLQASSGYFSAKNGECTSRSQGGTEYSVQVNCTTSVWNMWSGRNCNGTEFPGGEGKCSGPLPNGGYIAVLFGASSRLTSWITILASLLY